MLLWSRIRKHTNGKNEANWAARMDTWIRFNGLQMTWLQNLSLQGHEQHVDEHGGSESTVSIYLIKKQKLPDHNQV